MNTINVKIDFTNGINKLTGINLITGDYASTKMVFEFDKTDGRKVLEIKNPLGELIYVGEILNNEVVLASVSNGLNYSIFSTAGRYIYEVSLYDGDSKLTSVKGELPVQKEQVIIDGEVIEPYLPFFDELMQELNTAITETNNLNITGSKAGTTTTIVITKKDGTTQTLQVLDGEKGDKGDKGDAGAIKMLIVASLPSTGADDTIYLVPLETLDTSGNNYAEYVYINGAWELLGKIGVQVDLTDYVKNTDYASTTKGGVIKVNSGSFATTMYNGQLAGITKDYAQAYPYMSTDGFITKGTLENVITGKGLVSNTDYATNTTGGVLKVSNYYNASLDSDGALRSNVVSYSDYSAENNRSFISKGTLDNVLNATIGDIQTLLDNLDTGNGV